MFVDPYDGESCFQSDSNPGYFDWYSKNGAADGGGWGAWWLRGGACGLLRGRLQNLCRIKKSELAKLICVHPKPRPEAMPFRCVVC